MIWKSHGTNEKICESKTHSTKLDVFLRATMHFHPKQLRICSTNPKFKGIRIHLKIGFKIWSVECAYYKCVKGSQKQLHTLVRETTVVLIICLYRNEGENRHITFVNTLFLDFLTEGLRLCCRFYSSVPISSLPFTRWHDWRNSRMQDISNAYLTQTPDFSTVISLLWGTLCICRQRIWKNEEEEMYWALQCAWRRIAQRNLNQYQYVSVCTLPL